MIKLHEIFRLGVLSQKPLSGQAHPLPFTLIFCSIALRLALLWNVQPAWLRLPNDEICDMKRHIVASALETSNTYYLVAWRNLLVLNRVPVIAYIHWSTYFIDFFKNFLIFFVVGWDEACHSLVMHSRIHQTSDWFSFRKNIEYFVMNWLAAIILWMTHNSHNVVSLQI